MTIIPNVLQRFVLSRFSKVMTDCEMAGATKHGPSTGSIRESCVKQFLSEITPAGVKLTSGVLVDSTGQVSPQFDLIAIVPEVLPSGLLSSEISVVPVESAILCLEVKSMLDGKTLKQLEKQNEWISSAHTAPAKNSIRIMIPTGLIGLDSALSLDSVKSWMLKNPNTPFGTLVGKGYLKRNMDVVEMIDEGGGQEILNLASDHWGGLQHLLTMRRKAFAEASPHPFEVYLKSMANKKSR